MMAIRMLPLFWMRCLSTRVNLALKSLSIATHRISISSPRAPADVFEYLARFSNATDWDPGVSQAEDVTPGTPASGSRYRLMVRFLGLTVPLEYRIEEFAAPARVVLRAVRAMARSTDEIEVVPTLNCRPTVIYRACLTPKGPAGALAPLICMLSRRIGNRAADGLSPVLPA
jgi:hypothetical protein